MKIGKKYIEMRYKKGESPFSVTPPIHCHIGEINSPPGKPPLPREGGRTPLPKQKIEVMRRSQPSNDRSVKTTRRNGAPRRGTSRIRPQRKYGNTRVSFQNRRYK